MSFYTLDLGFRAEKETNII